MKLIKFIFFFFLIIPLLSLTAKTVYSQTEILLGDANGDQKVDGVDYVIWFSHYSKTTLRGHQDGDFDSNGRVDGVDYVVWLNNFGRNINSSPPTGFQPEAPYYATFFYLWSENPNTDGRWSYWSDRHSPPQNWFSHYLPDPNPSVFDPATELYSSNNESIINWQLAKLKEARQEVAIGSWWGQGHKSDRAFRKIITDMMNRPSNPYPRLRWALYYEKEGFASVPLSEILSDLNYIKTNYTNQPGYLKINGKPVIFVYNAAHGANPIDDYNRWSQARSQTGFYINMKRDPLSVGALVTGMDSWHEYAPASRSGSGTSWFFVSPGFWLEGASERLPRNASEFETAVRRMVSSNATWKLTETWNEWGEGSSVEPGDEVNQTTNGAATFKQNGYPFKNLYIDILNRNLPLVQ